jgi:hypothetical protein
MSIWARPWPTHVLPGREFSKAVKCAVRRQKDAEQNIVDIIFIYIYIFVSNVNNIQDDKD